MRVNLPSFEQLTSGIYADIGEMPDNEPILIRYLSEQPSPEVWSVSQAMPARHCRGPEPRMTMASSTYTAGFADATLNITPSDLILTNADFGDAYLRDGWASRYIEDRMRLNTLVLVGYAAEDTAMRLLLETLDADRERFRDLKNVYAIECQTPISASVWKAKGIRPVEFASYDEIYETLAEWAVYAQDPRGYASSRVNRILGGAP